MKSIYQHPFLYRFLDSLIFTNKIARLEFEKFLGERIEEGSKILDIGSNTGSFSKKFRNRYKITYVDKIYGIDASELPFSDDSFDYSTFVFSLSCIKDQYTALKEARRVSKKDVYVLDFIEKNIPEKLNKIGMKIFENERLKINNKFLIKTLFHGTYGIYEVNDE